MAELSFFNPWWRDGRVSQSLAGKKRRILKDVLQYLDLRQILIFSGLRRAGKTTLMFQMVDELLEGRRVIPYQILYFSFDEARREIDDILAEYQESILRRRLPQVERTYLFFDEIQKLSGWPEKVKMIYDLYPNVKIFLSGSAAIHIKKGTRESLAGRFFDFSIEPLDFDEYLLFMEKQIDKERENVFELEIRQNMDHFLRTGGFIEALSFNESQRERYFKEGLLERVIFRDIPVEYTVRVPDLLYQLTRILAQKPGMYLDYRNLANDLGYDQRTIAEYFSYLTHALLVSKLYNFAPNRLTSEKKMKRAYLSNTAFTAALSAETDISLVLEQFFINCFKGQFFSRTPQRDEIDLILTTDGGIIPVEVKIRRDIKGRDAGPLFKFMARHNVDKGYILSDRTEATFSDESGVVETIPYWKYWTIRKKLSKKD